MYNHEPENVRLADQTLGHYIGGGQTSILICINDDYAIRFPRNGFWVFRNSAAGNASEGDLRVFDQYAKDMLYDAMREDQIAKYESYDGYCHPVDDLAQTGTVCDLFLLSWTCTSIVGAGVWQISKDPNRHLGQTIVDLNIPNDHGQIPNVLYVDYCEFARVTDVALSANGAPYV
ncbi:MAG TPA: hypothetical protein VEK57_15620 [Thermoanaerobaculia bacterium]|nr:hypothetical protein [Thermoanaerobaculia bacterium]